MNDSNHILTLVLEATLPVQIVMVLLVLASILSWFWIFQRYFIIARSMRVLRVFEDDFWSGADLQNIYHRLEEDNRLVGVNNVFFDGFREFMRLRQKRTASAATMEGVQRTMRVAINREEEVLQKGLSTLASVGSVSPYVGLFGTVWGIMNSFLSLAASTEAVTITTVAPGIAEALIATAMGLIAAIPAVLAYNHFVSKSELLLSRYEVFAEEFSSILHRQLYSGGSAN